MSMKSHLARVVLLMGCAAGLLGYIAGRSSILFADGLRYIDQAKRLDRDTNPDNLFRSIDHPAYPLAIAGAHRLIGGTGPESWQVAAQAASVAAGVLLVVPLYLIALEMFGAASAWLAVFLTFLVPLTGQVMADTLSESWFLLFWSWGVWCGLRFLREGTFGWLPTTTIFAALAYWVRPEGVLLPVAMVATLAAVPLLRSTRMNWPRWWAAVAFLVIGPACLVAPIVAMKGGLATKPAVARLMGATAKSAPTAVERQKPLDPDQTETQTWVLAVRAMAISVRDAVTIPLLPFALLGLIFAWPPGVRARPWVFLGTIMVAWCLALVRLHATSGYCTPRHAMILAFPLIASAAFGLTRLFETLAIPGRWLGLDDVKYTAGPLVRLLALGGLIWSNSGEIREPLNQRFAGYRGAAEYLKANVPEGEKIVDVTGYSQFYGERPGYTYADLVAAKADKSIRRLVVRDAHLVGSWWYCDEIRILVGDRKPVATFPENPKPKQPVILVYDWSDKAVETARAKSAELR
ncbi:glycosyltransferase family 39 protein [Tundrisphaera sp. TA3]|uniref:glycosyltransferase family 39 protein n=1 Tax=Tundrisphaera sp. TA3 TaxID=3435775 RepID=UPI003EB78EE3